MLGGFEHQARVLRAIASSHEGRVKSAARMRSMRAGNVSRD